MDDNEETIMAEPPMYKDNDENVPMQASWYWRHRYGMQRFIGRVMFTAVLWAVPFSLLDIAHHWWK